ncbi:hypothetical protein B0J14DRAFT_618775 [Halenospora varia]|nr:hypothetical protein B0J14DRAFT_618775 [Halenospora varia]
MFTTPRKSTYNATSAYGSPTKKMPLKGLFQDGVWHCNCNPRLPASRFQVKKDGPNHGKYFYTCQEPKESSCGFFLWDDLAKNREKSALISNTRSEADTNKTPANASRDRRTIEGFNAASNKFMSDLARKEEEEFGDESLSDGDLVSVAEAASSQSQSQTLSPEIPRKAIKTSAFATPGSKRKWEESNGEVEGGMSDGSELSGMRSPSETPTPGRFRDATSGIESRKEENYDITDSVLDLLKDSNIDEETKASLKMLLNRHALKIFGVAKGRDITRVALKAKDTKIAELQQRITQLETEREMDKTVIRHFKKDMAESVANRGKGRGRGRGG